MSELFIKKEILLKVMDVIAQKLSFYMDDSIAIDHDYYHNIPMPDAYDLLNDANPTVGSLHDDWACLERLTESKELASLVDFDRLAAILKAISEELSR